MDAQPLKLPTGITRWQDTGFQGHTPGNVTVKMPLKKPKGKELTDEQREGKQENIEFPDSRGTCHRGSKEMSYCQRSIQVSQVWF
jgi:hypothetical protein